MVGYLSAKKSSFTTNLGKYWNVARPHFCSPCETTLRLDACLSSLLCCMNTCLTGMNPP